MAGVDVNREVADTGGRSGGEEPTTQGHEMLGVRWRRRSVLASIAFVLLSIAALYFVLPKLVGLRDTWNRIRAEMSGGSASPRPSRWSRS